jgi:membrane protein implicated in regulation of membrane protease activity
MKSKSDTVLNYTIYAIIGTLLEMILLVVVVIWIFPFFNILISGWGLAILVFLLLAFDVFTYTMGRRALNKTLLYGPEMLVGYTGTVVQTINPAGFVKVRGELWKALSESRLEEGQEVIITGISGMKLIVISKSEHNTIFK